MVNKPPAISSGSGLPLRALSASNFERAFNPLDQEEQETSTNRLRREDPASKNASPGQALAPPRIAN
jgi:hypothetical protein